MVHCVYIRFSPTICCRGACTSVLIGLLYTWTLRSIFSHPARPCSPARGIAASTKDKHNTRQTALAPPPHRVCPEHWKEGRLEDRAISAEHMAP